MIEAQMRARELGAPPQPDATEDQAQRIVRRAGLVALGLALAAGAWLLVGPEAAGVVIAALAIGLVAAWWVVPRLRSRGTDTPPGAPDQS